MKAVVPYKVFSEASMPHEFWCILLIIGITIGVFLIDFMKLLEFIIIVRVSKCQLLETLFRIVFGSMLITFVVCSAYSYSVILDNIHRPETQMSSLEELANSSLAIVLPADRYFKLETSFVPHIRELATRTPQSDEFIKLSYSPLSCLKYLSDYQNVSCLITDAEYHVNKYRNENGELNARILSETVVYYMPVWKVEPLSPYIDRYSKVIQRATETGLLKEFDEFEARC